MNWENIAVSIFVWLLFDQVASFLRARFRGRDCTCSEPLPGEYPDPAPAKAEIAARKVH